MIKLIRRWLFRRKLLKIIDNRMDEFEKNQAKTDHCVAIIQSDLKAIWTINQLITKILKDRLNR